MSQHQPPTTPPARRWALRLVAAAFGISLALALIAVLVSVLPRAPGGPVRFTVGMGDLFAYRPNQIAPPADPNRLLSDHWLGWDSDGFRLPAKPAARYDVIALGDSFTEAPNAARPWPDVLAAESGLAVYNMGYRGFGPDESLRVLQEYGPKHAPKLVILGYYEGNDLNDAVSVRWREQPYVRPADARQTLTPFAPPTPAPPPPGGNYPYPITLELNGQRHEVAFLDAYLSILNGALEAYSQSANLAAVEGYFKAMKAVLPGACFVVAYFPTAPHIYARHVIPEHRGRVLASIEEMYLTAPNSYLLSRPNTLSYDEVLARIDNQRTATTAVLARLGIPMIDLTPAFQAAAMQGQYVWYAYDTHWSDAGHQVAGAGIASWLRANPAPCGNGN
jgi:hypothetical protein